MALRPAPGRGQFSRLAAAGIDADTPDPPEGRIERDDRGRPTGILRELAINMVRAAVAPPDMDQVIDAFQDGIPALHRRGVTAIHDMRLMADQDGARALRALQRLEQDRALDLRCWVTLPGERLDDIVALGLRPASATTGCASATSNFLPTAAWGPARPG